MTDRPDRPRTMIEEAEADPTLSLEMAAARGAIEGSALIARVFDGARITQHELAQLAQVSDGRVSQVLAGEENLRLSTVARYLHAMGYRLALTAINQQNGTVVDTRRRVPARRGQVDGTTERYAWIEHGPLFATREFFASDDWATEADVLHVPAVVHVATEDPRNMVVRMAPEARPARKKLGAAA